ncbi:hypothetical protein TNCV_1335631 [Trichonephila clavipes]|nr:hypothetical protein TNCV_1335631 [Trichonephila clavipes]
MGFGCEVLPRLPYSPDLPPTDYHLLRALNNSFFQKITDDLDAVKTAVNIFLLETAGILPPWDSSPTRKITKCSR